MTTPDISLSIHAAAELSVRIHKDSHLLNIPCDSEACRRAASFHAALDLLRLRGANPPISFSHLVAAYREFESLIETATLPAPHPPLTNMGFDGGDSTLDEPAADDDDTDHDNDDHGEGDPNDPETTESSDEDIEHLRTAGTPPTLLEHPFIPSMDPD